MSLNMNKFSMQFKSEYRWLLFLLVPFITLLTIHIAVPLTFQITNQQPVIKQYTDQYILNMVKSLRTYTMEESETFSYRLDRCITYLSTIIALLENNSSQMQINGSKVSLNNAYTYYHSTNTNTQNRSMWYAQNKMSEGELSQHQANILAKYQTVQPFITQTYLQPINSLIVQGLFFSYNHPTQSIAFHYPSYPETHYSTINNTIITSPYTTYSNIHTSPRNIVLLPHTYGSNFHNDTFALCSALSWQAQPAGVACIQINLNLYLGGLVQALYVLEAVGVGSSGYLVSPISTGTEPPVLSEFKLKNSSFSITYPRQNTNYSSLTPYSNQIWASEQCNMGSINSFQSYRSANALLIIVPLCVSSPQTGLQQPVMFYSFQIMLLDLTTGLSSAQSFSSSRQTLLIPVILCILLFTVLSFLILKYILKNLDLQFFKLNQMCKYIADGDMQIKIPEYKGTKDIAQLYQEIKVINRIFRYTSRQYFSGHHAQKIVKYLQAIKVFQEIGYDSSCLYQNIGDCYYRINEYQKSIDYTKKSVALFENSTMQGYLSFQHMKTNRELRNTNIYKEKEIIILRRLWTLINAYMKLLEFSLANTYITGRYNVKDAETIIREKYTEEFCKYSNKFRNILSPNLGSTAEGALSYIYEAIYLVLCGDYRGAKICYNKSIKPAQVYERQYDSVTVRMKEKGSKNRYLHRRNRLTSDSRTHPQVIFAFLRFTEAMIWSGCDGPDLCRAFFSCCQSFRSSIIFVNLSYAIMGQTLLLAGKLGVSTAPLQTTQILRELMPFKALHYGPIPTQQQQLLRKQASNQQIQREYIYMYDAGQLLYPFEFNRTLLDYTQQRSNYIFDKHIKGQDRLSIVKFNSHIQLQTLCNLTLKEANQCLLRKTFNDLLVQGQFRSKNGLITALQRVLYRVKKLQCEKVIVVYMRPYNSYIYDSKRMKKKLSRIVDGKDKNPESMMLHPKSQSLAMPQIGQQICQLMGDKQMRNCKLVLMCSKVDDDGQFIRAFGLKDINKRIWARWGGINASNNLVYVISEKHKVDIERILVTKLTNPLDNNVFIF